MGGNVGSVQLVATESVAATSDTSYYPHMFIFTHIPFITAPVCNCTPARNDGESFAFISPPVLSVQEYARQDTAVEAFPLCSACNSTLARNRW